MSRFAAALAEHPAPRKVGDVTLRFEPSMLIGEATKAPRTWRPTIAWLLGLGALLVDVACFILELADTVLVTFAGLGALGLTAATWLEQLERRRRRFIVNFGTNSLRLDFSSPIVGRPRTLVVHFDAVRAVELYEQGDGAHCLTVDFLPSPGSNAVLREVLVAGVSAPQLEDAARLTRVLEGAFGLGEVPADSPAMDETTFEPGKAAPTRPR